MAEQIDLTAAIDRAITFIAGSDARELATTAVTAAAPLIEQAVREQVAKQIEAEARWQRDANHAGPLYVRRYEHAAAIARGGESRGA